MISNHKVNTNKLHIVTVIIKVEIIVVVPNPIIMKFKRS